MRPRLARPLWQVLAAALLLAAVAAPSARAGYDPIASGTTKLSLAKGFTALLRANGVRISGRAGATVAGNVVTFPVVSGQFDPVSGKGNAGHEGTLVFSAGGRSLPLKALQLKTTRRSAPYAAKLGGGQLKLGTTTKLVSARAGFGAKVSSATLKLSEKVAVRLGKKLRLRGVFAAGQPFAKGTTTVAPAGVGIALSGKAELTIDPAFAAKLQSLFVAVNPIAPAEHPGAFTFPIGGGTLALAPGTPASGLKANGALEFIQVGGGQFFVRELEFDLSDSVANAESQLVLAASGPGPNQGGAIFSLVGAAATADPATRTISLVAAPLTLEAAPAQAFNEAFCKPLGKPDAFNAGEVLGTISFTAQAE
jgi:hypothetical protein